MFELHLDRMIQIPFAQVFGRAAYEQAVLFTNAHTVSRNAYIEFDHHDVEAVLLIFSVK